MAIVTVGIDLAKNVFALHGVNEAGHVDLNLKTAATPLLPEPEAGRVG